MALLAVSGTRHPVDPARVERHLERYFRAHRVVQILVGDCPTGVDKIVRDWCKRVGFPVGVYVANWERDGDAAGPIRNKAMIAAATRLVAFPAPDSRGTRNAIDLARKKGIAVEVQNVVPLRLA